MESTRVGRVKRTFADEVTNLHQEGARCRLDDGKEGPAQGTVWFKFSYCYELRNHGLCRQNRSALLWIFASIHDVSGTRLQAANKNKVI